MNKAGRLLQKRILAALISGGLLLLPSCGYTLPSGGAVVNGSGSITSGGGTMDITGSGNVAINWDSFNIAQNETVNFKNMQAVLNYVSGSGKSEIFGKLNGSGVNVFLINPNGILFGKTAQVNVGQLTASTRKQDANALKGFNGSLAGLNATEAADVRGDIINLGRLTAGRLVLEGSNLSIIGADSLEVVDKKNITLRANENINIGYEVKAKTTIDVGDGQGNTHVVSDYKDGSGSKASDVLSGATVTDLTGGGKSINDAMLVHDVYELQAINNNAEEKRNDKNFVYKYVHGNYMLANDIDASATSTWNSGKGFESIGQLTQMTMGTPKGFQGGFTGVLDGAGYTVKDLSINRSDEVYVGLFGGLTETAAVMNLNLTGNILGKNNVGGIAARNFGMIRNVVNKANVSGESLVGGITGMNCGRLESVTNGGAVTGTSSNVGGIAGKNGDSSSQTGSIINAQNIGSINGNGIVGGIVGDNFVNSIIANASNSGEVTSTGQYTGGISGTNRGSLTNIDNFGKVTGTNQVGGISGANHNNAVSSQNAGTIDKANNTGAISGKMSVGGIVGANYSNISNSSNSGDVIGTLQKIGGIVGLNGLLDAKSGTIENVTNIGAVTGTTYVGGISGENKSAKIENARNSGKVNADFDNFQQSLSGGITGYNSSGGQIFSAVNTGVVSGKGSFVGGICGASDGVNSTVKNVYNSGNITGSVAVGGIVGSNDNGNTLENVYNLGTVSGSDAVNGYIIGQSDSGGTITNAYFVIDTGYKKYDDNTEYSSVKDFNQAFLDGMQEGDKALWLSYGDKTTPLLRGLLQSLNIDIGDIEVEYSGSAYEGLVQAVADKLEEQGIIIDTDKLLAEGKTEVGEYALSDLLYSLQDGYDITASGKLIIKEKAAPPEPSYDAGSDGKYSAAVAKLHAEKAYQEEHRVMDKRRKNMFVQTAVVIEDEGIKLEEE
ncbi:filamentous hemagglutinin N-terminal domain-containing protein [Phascolarctobacterium faecium]|uniref:filamentous hemagglutinin N-terminal domain-containing protein n=1 Tax=Phascolarctobacterium faecium TaxID=33025 RepID=UPI003AB20A7E